MIGKNVIIAYEREVLQMIKYTGLFDILNHRGMKKTDLLDTVSSKTIAKLSKDEPLSGEIIEKLCERLKCQPGDIMTYFDEGIAEVEGKEQKLIRLYTIDYESPNFRSIEDVGIIDSDGEIEWF